MKNIESSSPVTLVAAAERSRGRLVLGALVALACVALGAHAFSQERKAAAAPPETAQAPATPPSHAQVPPVPAHDAPTAAEPVAAGRPIDLVLCLDTSNSMDGLIESVKRKLWDITNELARAKPTPRLRVALLTYGTPEFGTETGFVRIDSQFTDDLDGIQQKLFALRTSGGDEFVGRVLRTAVQQLAWSDEKDALRVAFVCGNESADQDPVVKFRDAVRAARERGVFVNAIYCGAGTDPDAALWREIPLLGEGSFASIDHNQPVVEVRSPFDARLAELSTALNGTYVAIGAHGRAGAENQSRQDSNSGSLGSSSVASRACAKGSSLYKCSWDAIDANVDIATVKDEDLPEELRKLTPEERKAYVAKKAADRAAIQKEIAEVGAKRQAFVAEELKKRAGAGEAQLDGAIKQAIREQAERKGFSFGGC
ncbi:VWA domain-containing protein [bacterium]|nr:VWA domain-containing protein [bacterium]